MGDTRDRSGRYQGESAGGEENCMHLKRKNRHIQKRKRHVPRREKGGVGNGTCLEEKKVHMEKGRWEKGHAQKGKGRKQGWM